MKNAILTLTLGLLAAPVLAQGTEEDTRANANVLPMIQEQVQGFHAQVVTACIVATAQPEEKAQLAAAAGPSQEIAPIVNTVLGRPAAVDCLKATLAQQ